MDYLDSPKLTGASEALGGDVRQQIHLLSSGVTLPIGGARSATDRPVDHPDPVLGRHRESNREC